MFKKLSIFTFLAFNFALTFAAGSCDLVGDDAPDPGAIACIIGRIINIGFMAVGIVFVAMIAYGAIKLAMALGDPKGFQGAVMTWQHSLMGFAIVLLFFAILMFIGKALGVPALDPNTMVGFLQGAINQLFDIVKGSPSGF